MTKHESNKKGPPAAKSKDVPNMAFSPFFFFPHLASAFAFSADCNYPALATNLTFEWLVTSTTSRTTSKLAYGIEHQIMMINSHENIGLDSLSINKRVQLQEHKNKRIWSKKTSGHNKMDREQISCPQWQHAEFTFILDMLRKERSIAGSYLHTFGWETTFGEVNTCYNHNPWRKKTVCLPWPLRTWCSLMLASNFLRDFQMDGCLEICTTKWDFVTLTLKNARYYTAFRSPPKNSWNDLVCSWWVVTALVGSVDCYDVPFSPPIVLPLVVGCLIHVHVLASGWCHRESSHSTVTTLGVLKQRTNEGCETAEKMMSFLSLTFRSVPLGQKWLRNWNSKCKDFWIQLYQHGLSKQKTMEK